MLDNQPHRERCYWCDRPLAKGRLVSVVEGKVIDGIYCSPICKDRGQTREQQRLEMAARMCTASTWNGS